MMTRAPRTRRVMMSATMAAITASPACSRLEPALTTTQRAACATPNWLDNTCGPCGMKKMDLVGWLDKNRGYLHPDLALVLTQSKSELVRQLFPPSSVDAGTRSTPRRRSRPSTAASPPPP